MPMADAYEPSETPFLGFHSRELQLKVVLVYEDFEMGVQGKEIFDLIAREAGGEDAARLTVWRFDFFHSAELTAAVSHQTEEADVIIVAPRDPNFLPPQVRAWLERWPQHRKLDGGAVVALFHPSVTTTAKSSDTALLLWRAACRAQMDFICRKGKPVSAAIPSEYLTAGARTVAASPVTFTGTAPAHTTGWGLND